MPCPYICNVKSNSPIYPSDLSLKGPLDKKVAATKATAQAHTLLVYRLLSCAVADRFGCGLGLCGYLWGHAV